MQDRGGQQAVSCERRELAGITLAVIAIVRQLAAW